jgi:UDPglucose--hexose-1-phosphate uridylyltransferase
LSGKEAGVPTLRQDIATRRWTIIATDRAKRPEDFVKQRPAIKKHPSYSPTCPFCAGNESQTPEPVYVVAGEASPRGAWDLRVVPNRFPALATPRAGSEPTKRRRTGLHLEMDGCGQHEVVIESPDHSETIATMSLERVTRVIHAYRERFLALDRLDWNELIIIFRNQGEGAGTSLEHPHSQIIGAPVVPQDIRCRLDEAQRYFDDNGTCVYCDMLEAEIEDGARIVCANSGFVSLCPFAASVPYATWILPRRHASSFGVLSDEEAGLLAMILQETLLRMYVLLSNPDYNYVVRTAPHHSAGEPHFHWYVETQPRLTTRAGIEIGSGLNVNIVAPEDAAENLRKAF